MLAATIVELVSPEPSNSGHAAPHRGPHRNSHWAQQGRLIAVNPDSLTTQSTDGLIQTYSVTPSTTAITD